MTAAQRIAAFLAVLVLTFAAGYGIGAAIDPVLEEDGGHPAVEHEADRPPEAEHGGHEDQGEGP
jgi:hypothetical protein